MEGINHQNWLKNKQSTYKKRKHPFWHPGVLWISDKNTGMHFKFVEGYPMSIPAKFGSNCSCDFREGD
jgi:hypothetical protein